MDEELKKCVEIGDLSRLQELLGNVADDQICSSILVEAIKLNRVEYVERLLKDGRVDVNFGADLPIRMAAEMGHLEIVRMLLENPAVRPNALGNYAVRYSSENGHFSVVHALLNDSRVDVSDDNSWAVICASMNGYLNIVNLLLEHRVHPSRDHNSAIGLAAKNGHLLVVQRLLQDPRVQPQEDSNYALRMACREGHSEIVHLLLSDERVDPYEYGVAADSPFTCACEGGNMEIVNLFIEEHHIMPTIQGLETAISKGHEQVARILLKNVNPFQSLAMTKAIQCDQSGMVELLLEDGRSNLTNLSETILTSPTDAIAPLLAKMQVRQTLPPWDNLPESVKKQFARLLSKVPQCAMAQCIAYGDKKGKDHLTCKVLAMAFGSDLLVVENDTEDKQALAEHVVASFFQL